MTKVLFQKKVTVEVDIDLTDAGLAEVERLYEQFQTDDIEPMDPTNHHVTYEVAVDDVSEIQATLLNRAMDIERSTVGD